MAGLSYPEQISELLSEIEKTYAQNSDKINARWVVSGDLFRQNFYEALIRTERPVELLEAFHNFLNDDTGDNEEILNGLFIEMNQNFDLHSAQSEGLNFDEQPPEYVAVRNKTTFKSANKK